jgi:hypothetical protein
MNVHAWKIQPLLGAVAIACIGWGNGGWTPVQAQSPSFSSASRDSGGWQATPARPAPGVQTAYFQAAGNFSDSLPAFPGGGSAPMGAYEGVSAASGVGGMVSPTQAMPNIPMPHVAPPANSYQPTLPPNTPAPSTAGDLRSPQRERLPPGQTANGLNPQNSSLPPRNPATQPNAAQPNAAQLTTAQLTTAQLTAAQAPGSLPTGAGARLDPQAVTSGYPFVAPPPRSQYATAPYQPAVFQTTYQSPRPTQGTVAQLTSAVQAPPAAPNLSAAPFAPQPPSALPQFQALQPGIYPTAYQCTTPAPSFPSTGAVPGAYVPPTLPPNLTPGLYTPNNSGHVPLFSLGQENYNVQLGRGIIGQPTVYVPGQPIRNFMRYLSP